MSHKRLRAEIDLVLSNTGQAWEAGTAAITDLLRVLHELVTKNGGNRADLLSQVQVVFGVSAMAHLARVIDASPSDLTHYQKVDDAALYARVVLICKQRGFALEDGLHFLEHFFKALDEERSHSDGSVDSATAMVYRAVGEEAAYHLRGLYEGDAYDLATTGLIGYLDPKLKRFNKLVEIWRMEMAWDKEDAG